MRHFALRGPLAVVLSVLLLTMPVLAAADMTGTVNTSTLRLRAEPSLSAEILDMLSNGTGVTILDSAPIVNDSGTWYKIKYKDTAGYMSAEFLSVSDGAVNARANVSADRLNFRAEPSTSAKVLTVLTKGTGIRIINDDTNGWYKAEYDGVTGYIKSEFISLSSSKSSSGKTGVAGKYGQVTSSRVNFRSAADLDASVKTILSIGAVIKLTGAKGDWYSADYNGSSGYIHSDYIKVTSSKPASKNTGNAAGQKEGTAALSNSNATEEQAALVEIALSKLGSPYVYGAGGPNSFDCSGFTSWVYRQCGISLQRTALDQYRLNGRKISSVSSLQPGDLVFIRDPHVSRNAVSHVGLYVGDGKMIHAGSGSIDGGKRVKISSLTTGYYKNYFVAGKRVVS